MGIGSHDQLSRTYIILHHDLVADSLSFIKGDVMFPGEVPHFPVGLRSFWILRRNIVVNNEDQFVFICNLWMF